MAQSGAHGWSTQRGTSIRHTHKVCVDKTHTHDVTHSRSRCCVRRVFANAADGASAMLRDAFGYYTLSGACAHACIKSPYLNSRLICHCLRAREMRLMHFGRGGPNGGLAKRTPHAQPTKPHRLCRFAAIKSNYCGSYWYPVCRTRLQVFTQFMLVCLIIEIYLDILAIT